MFTGQWFWFGGSVAHYLIGRYVYFRKSSLKKRRNQSKKKHTNGYRDPLDYAHVSSEARYRLLYTPRKINNSREKRILWWAHKGGSYRYQFGYYIVGVVTFMSWPVFKSGIISLFGYLFLGYVFYRYFRMTWSYEERITYEREYPVKTITEVHRELVRDGLLTSICSIVLTLILYILVNSLSQ